MSTMWFMFFFILACVVVWCLLLPITRWVVKNHPAGNSFGRIGQPPSMVVERTAKRITTINQPKKPLPDRQTQDKQYQAACLAALSSYEQAYQKACLYKQYYADFELPAKKYTDDLQAYPMSVIVIQAEVVRLYSLLYWHACQRQDV